MTGTPARYYAGVWGASEGGPAMTAKGTYGQDKATAAVDALQVLDHDWRRPGGIVINVVAAVRKVLAVCMVRTRAGSLLPAAKRKQVRSLAAALISAHGTWSDEIRIGVAALVYEAGGGYTIERVRGAG